MWTLMVEVVSVLVALGVGVVVFACASAAGRADRQLGYFDGGDE